MTELLVGTKKGLFVLEGEPGDAVRGHRARVRRRAGRVRDARPAHEPHPRGRDQPVLRAEDLRRRGPERRVGAGQGRRAARGRGGGARADLGDRARRGRRRAVRGRRPRRAVQVDRRRAELGARAQPVRAPDAAGLDAGRRRAVPALDRAVAGRAGQARARALRGRRLADRRRRRDLAPRQPGPRRPLPARGAAGGDARAVRPRPPARAASAPSGCSSSSTAASTAPTTRARAGPTSATGCRRTSASRSSSTPPTPTART